MGIYSETISRYLTVKWTELVVALFLWCVALILYLSLEHRRIVAARNRRDRALKNSSARVAQSRLVKEKRRCAFYVALFGLILASCLWSYLSDMIPAYRDLKAGSFEEYTGVLVCEERCGGLISSVEVTDQSGTVRQLSVQLSLRRQLLGGQDLPQGGRGTVVFGKESGVIVLISFASS